jgi:hypothetical protein
LKIGPTGSAVEVNVTVKLLMFALTYILWNGFLGVRPFHYHWNSSRDREAQKQQNVAEIQYSTSYELRALQYDS